MNMHDSKNFGSATKRSSWRSQEAPLRLAGKPILVGHRAVIEVHKPGILVALDETPATPDHPLLVYVAKCRKALLKARRRLCKKGAVCLAITGIWHEYPAYEPYFEPYFLHIVKPDGTDNVSVYSEKILPLDFEEGHYLGWFEQPSAPGQSKQEICEKFCSYIEMQDRRFGLENALPARYNGAIFVDAAARPLASVTIYGAKSPISSPA